MTTNTRQLTDNTTATADIDIPLHRQGQRLAADQRHQRRDDYIAELQEQDGIRDRQGRRGGGRRRHAPARGRRVKNVDLRTLELDY